MSSSVVDLTHDDPAPAGKKRGITNDDLRTLARERERRQRLQPPAPQPARPASTSTGAAIGDEVWASRANVEEVRVMRLGESPVIAFQNFGGDRGVRMAQITRLEETVRKAKEGTRSRYRSRVELDADSGVGPSIDMKIAAERLMSLALNHPEVRNDPAAIASLRRQTEWGGSATLLYPAGATLGRHKDVRAPRQALAPVRSPRDSPSPWRPPGMRKLGGHLLLWPVGRVFCWRHVGAARERRRDPVQRRNATRRATRHRLRLAARDGQQRRRQRGARCVCGPH